VVRDRDEASRPAMLRWRLAPRWATLKGGPSLINARDDKIASSNAWKPLVRSACHRALIIAHGWIEWMHAEEMATSSLYLHPAAAATPSGAFLNLGRPEVLAGARRMRMEPSAPALRRWKRRRAHRRAFQPEGPAGLRSHVAAVGLREGAGLRKLGELCRHRVALAPERCRHVPRGRAGVRAHILDDLPP
jgi:SOS response associated peptidase (SRAP)